MKQTVVFILILVIVAGAAAYVMQHRVHRSPGAADQAAISQVYESSTYGYSFAYPADLALVEYQPFAVAVGDAIPDGLTAYAEADVSESGEEGGYASFEEYEFERGRNFCAADGPNESISCDKIVSREPFTTDTGISGDKLTFRLIHKDLKEGTQTESTFGPVYAFNIQANTPDSKYSALFIYPPLATYENARPELVTAIASSLQISKVNAQ
jgi:hypothetical protein